MALTSGRKPHPLGPSAEETVRRREIVMTERELRLLVDQVRRGELPRRRFVERMLGLGLTVQVAGMMLMQAGVASAQTAPPYKPTRRGGGGTLRILQSEG